MRCRCGTSRDALPSRQSQRSLMWKHIFCMSPKFLLPCFLVLLSRCTEAVDGSNNNNNHYRSYSSSSTSYPHELYDATNPLWREEHHYTGERKGPETLTTRGDGFLNSFVSRRNKVDNNYRNSNDIEEEDDHLDLLDHMLWHDHPFRRGGGIGDRDDAVGRGSRRRGSSNTSGNSNKSASFTSKVQRVSNALPPSPPSRRRSNNSLVQFKRRAGRFNVDFFNTPSTTPADPESRPNEKKEEQGASTDGASTSATSSTAVVETPKQRKAVVTTPDKADNDHNGNNQSPLSSSSPTTTATRNVEIALSVDPFSLVALLQTTLLATAKLFSATFASLRLIGPMILAKRCLQTVGYIFYDHYNGRYIRNVYTKRMQHMQELEVIASARALGRFFIQLLAMSVVGKVMAWAVLGRANSSNQSLIPCLLKPSWICDWWAGLMWMGSVGLTGWVVSVAMAKEGYTINGGSNSGSKDDTMAAGKFYRNPLSIRPTVMGTPATNLRRWRRNAEESQLDKLLQLPWQLIQWMKDPEESINKMIRFANYKSNYPIRASPGPKAKTAKLDTFLFPSTWRPLRIWSCLVIVQCIVETLSAPPTTSTMWKSSFNSRRRIMKAFLIQAAVHNEWYRVFVKERRVALGAIISLIELFAFIRMILVATWIDKLTGLALIPVLIAQVVTSYMNTILYFDHYLPSARPPSEKRTKQMLVSAIETGLSRSRV